MIDLMDLAVISNKAGLHDIDLLHYRKNISTGSVPLALAWFLPYCSRGCTQAGHTVKEQVHCAQWPYQQIDNMPFPQCKLIYRWAAKLYHNHTLMRLANAMPANGAGAGGKDYYTYGLSANIWTDLVYPDTSMKTDDRTALCPNRSAVLHAATRQYKTYRQSFGASEYVSVLHHTRHSTAGRWKDSSVGVHSWLVFDYHVSPANATAFAPNFDFIWGSSPQRAPAWRNGSKDIVVSRYINGNRDSTFNAGNLTWWRLNHPTWVMYTCKNNTGQRNVAWSDGDVDMPLDWSNLDVIKYQLAHYTCGCYVCPCASGDPGGYNAIAVDGYHFANFGHACGHYDRDWTDPDAKFIQQYTTDGPARGRWGDSR